MRRRFPRGRWPFGAGAAALLLVSALGLGGCVEAGEEIRFDSDGSGSGTYVVRIAWDADLVESLRGTVGDAVLARVARGAPPLREAAWRDSLKGVAGLRLVACERALRVDGWRTLRVVVAFRRLGDLAAWEMFGRRAIALELRRPEGKSPRDDDVARKGDRATLRMDPFARVPVLDVLADASRILAGPEGEARVAKALGVLPEHVDVITPVLQKALEEVRLRVRVVVPGEVQRAAGAAEQRTHEAAFVTSFEDLRRGRDRSIRLTWSPRDFDRIQPFVHGSEH